MNTSNLFIAWCHAGAFSRALADANGVTGNFDAATVTSKADLLKAIGRALDFPDYFSPNWDSFEECLAEPDHLEPDAQLTLGIRHAECLFDMKDAGTLFSIFRIVADEWRESGARWSLKLILEGEMDQQAEAVLNDAGISTK